MPAPDKHPDPSVAQAEVDLYNATNDHKEAEQKYREARINQTAATNRLNDAQKAFDAAVVKLRSQAPASSNWKVGATGSSDA